MSAAGTAVWAARYTGEGLTSVFSEAVVQSVEASVMRYDTLHHDERLVVVKFIDNGSVHMVPYYLVFPIGARPLLAEGSYLSTRSKAPGLLLQIVH